jgi:hypothetical protein
MRLAGRHTPGQPRRRVGEVLVGRARAVVALTVGIVVSLFPMASQASSSSCPAVKTCGAYVLDDYRWPAHAGQPLVIPYYVSTAISNPSVPSTELPEIVRRAAAVWEHANPRVHFRYVGLTSALPGLPYDGHNVIGYGVPAAPGAEAANAVINYTQSGRVLEEDLVIDPTTYWTWDSCPQRDGGCAGHSADLVPAPVATNTWGPELQGVLTHELGHWLSLDHSDPAGGSNETMFSAVPPDNLKMQTLGLGDILGARAAYPCGSCGGTPRVYAP